MTEEHKGGIIRLTGGRLSFPAILPRGEAIIPNPQYEQMQSRLKRSMTEIPKFTANITLAAEGAARFSAAMQRVQESLRVYQDRVMLMAIHAGYEDKPPFTREHRIAKLLLSRDRRQRKRGERLFRVWRASRPGINFNRYRKD